MVGTNGFVEMQVHPRLQSGGLGIKKDRHQHLRLKMFGA